MSHSSKEKVVSRSPKNYRPVAILSFLSKMIERAMFKQLFSYIDSNKFYNPNHHAYGFFHSSSTAILQICIPSDRTPWRRGHGKGLHDRYEWSI